jgi:hypothetical protein
MHDNFIGRTVKSINGLGWALTQISKLERLSSLKEFPKILINMSAWCIVVLAKNIQATNECVEGGFFITLKHNVLGEFG